MTNINIFTTQDSGKPTYQETMKSLMSTILHDSTTSIISTLSSFLIYSTVLMFLGHSDDTLTNINSAQIGFICMCVLGMTFIISSLNSFDSLGSISYANNDFDMFHEMFNNAKLFMLLVFLIIYLPLNFTSHYILYALGFEKQIADLASTFMRICIVSNFLDLLQSLNTKVLQIMGKYFLVMCINLITLVIHIINCIIFIYNFKLGIVGAGICVGISSLCSFLLTSYFVYTMAPFKDKDILLIDTTLLNSSSKFFYYSRSAIGSGLIFLIKELIFYSVVFASYYLGPISLASSTIIENYITLFYYVLLGVTTPITQKVNSYLINQKYQTYLNFTKVSGILAAIIAAVISCFNYFFKYKMCALYVDNPIVCQNFAYVINLYCFIIFFDWASNILNSILKGVNLHTRINVIFSLLLLFVFLPIGILLSFTFGFDYVGFWYSIFASMIVFTIIQYVYLSGLDLEDESQKIIKSLRRNTYHEEILFK
jgi:MATE family multidrug resistance protein